MTNQQTSTFRAAFNEARSSFHKATTRLSEIESEARALKEHILYLRRTITALAPLCSGDPRVDKLGITDVCIEAMNLIPYTASTADVVRWIEMYGFDISGQKNADASVHAVLTRLAKDEKITKIGSDRGVRWRGPNYDKDLDDMADSQQPAEITDEDIPF